MIKQFATILVFCVLVMMPLAYADTSNQRVNDRTANVNDGARDTQTMDNRRVDPAMLRRDLAQQAVMRADERVLQQRQQVLDRQMTVADRQMVAEHTAVRRASIAELTRAREELQQAQQRPVAQADSDDVRLEQIKRRFMAFVDVANARLDIIERRVGGVEELKQLSQLQEAIDALRADLNLYAGRIDNAQNAQQAQEFYVAFQRWFANEASSIVSVTSVYVVGESLGTTLDMLGTIIARVDAYLMGLDEPMPALMTRLDEIKVNHAQAQEWYRAGLMHIAEQEWVMARESFSDARRMSHSVAQDLRELRMMIVRG